jgi:branched-chain amino acid transport system permease protein
MNLFIEKIKNHLILILGIILLFIITILSWYADLPFLANVIFLCILYSIMGMAWNLLTGYGGQFSLGHSIFFGVGAYTTGVLLARYGITPWLGIFVGAFLAGLNGLALGVPFFRLKSHWFTLATIAASTIYMLTFTVWDYVGGSVGLNLPIVPKELAFYYMYYQGPYFYALLALVILIIEIIILNMIVKSKIGIYLTAIRDEEEAAKHIGINPFKYKMIAMFISALFTGISGGLYAVRFGILEPFAVYDIITVSVYISITGILGGIYNFYGPIVGAFIFMPITEYVRTNIVVRYPMYYGLHVMVVGIILIFISLVMPEGVLGWLEKKGILRKETIIVAPEGD